MKPRGRISKRFLLLVALIAAAVFGVYYFFFSAPSSPQGPGGPGGFAMPVDAVKVRPEALSVKVDTVGTLRSNEAVTLRPEVPGRVEDIRFAEGERVKNKEVLIQLDDRLARAELQQAEAQLKLARTEQARARKLQSKGAVSQARLDQANADLSVADANAGVARAQLDKYRIYAPFDGMVGLRHISPGDYVTVGQELARFESFNPMKVDFTVPEIYAPLLADGQTLAISVDALPGESFEGTVYAIDPQVSASGRSISVRATVPNPDHALKPGYFARINLQVDDKQNALMIPEAAIVPKGSESYVYAVREGNKTELVTVKPGVRRDGKVEILEGLKKGDVVIVAGQMKIQPGMEVMPQMHDEASGAKNDK